MQYQNNIKKACGANQRFNSDAPRPFFARFDLLASNSKIENKLTLVRAQLKRYNF
jgi:hypothetical protein